MSRIVYMMIGTDGATGGHKIAIRHVEALAGLGFNAVAYLQAGNPEPRWFAHLAPIQVGGILADDDILVIPEDALAVLRQFACSPHRKIVFCQNPFYAAAAGLGVLTSIELASYREFIACGDTVGRWLARFFPGTSVGVIPAFADERRFKPARKLPIIACAPRKRKLEFRCIHFMFHRLYSGSTSWRWAVLEAATEERVAQTFGAASVFLSLNRLEALGITTLEAMTCGCVPAGFTGVGGRDYATPANGFWVDEDDCEACAIALLEAVKLVETGGSGLSIMTAAAKGTASRFSHRAFLGALRAYWSAPRSQLIAASH